ncbi:DUF4856 domain-containing protein [Reichenbachiella sp. 5M10]|uniref:DUF4856 domain-containing protein n=1 Tax=Reichenbachiella sp. 5M10 TaxID=1889772 RepID=UPI000C151166|nr:DUF4856 domain-containing protein [Reichenbachiella sp. 5M10]PIB35326.1 DUF4856 domain-containing protein [Reichenbachiella sp. 5M10]
MCKVLRSGLLSLAIATMVSCQSDDEGIDFDVPTSYVFEREGSSSVSFDGQTTRIAMSEEIITALKDDANTTASLLAMYDHQQGADDFSNAELNDSDKNPRSKTAASSDYFSANATASAAFKSAMDSYITDQVTEVFPNYGVQAAAGTAGQLADGDGIRYVNAQGLEYNQMFAKSLIGALMTDQILNNYLSTTVLDGGTNVADNDAGTVEESKSYTSMEHKWDEAYGYVYGQSQDPANPNVTIGEDDSFLNEYIGKVDQDEDFSGIAEEIFQGYLIGRAAIVAGDYQTRNEQAEIIQENISLVLAVRGVYYLQSGKEKLDTNKGGAFHALSEALGFINSLQFTRVPGTDHPYFTQEEVDTMIASLLGTEGFWGISKETLDDVSDTIADKFNFSVAKAAD